MWTKTQWIVVWYDLINTMHSGSDHPTDSHSIVCSLTSPRSMSSSQPLTSTDASNGASSPADRDSTFEESEDRLSAADLEALRNRDPHAVKAYIYGNKAYLRNVLRRFTASEEAARDLLQETFFQALRSLPNFRGESKLTTWLYSIAKNVALARYRKNQRRTAHEENTLSRIAAEQDSHPGSPVGESATWNPAAQATQNEEKALVHEALDELSESYRRVIELRDLKERTTKEVAEELDLTRVNVRVRLHRARTKLAEILTERLEPDYQVAG